MCLCVVYHIYIYIFVKFRVCARVRARTLGPHGSMREVGRLRACGALCCTARGCRASCVWLVPAR
eukprot:NODE_2608_length_766_cov_149.952580_g1826_i0.p4 GENE.NODE_2608_length_766_cov_149.952580_g1826_i0~~NODE_2608_length_766_cov_149.952580_g1826_i0.p4  ORF type:complete len:65 (+),score=3.54 NODE_2608_length_766_cov_149.952580_g1826_i0:226-420(+)